jgi:hypothetical protein
VASATFTGVGADDEALKLIVLIVGASILWGILAQLLEPIS